MREMELKLLIIEYNKASQLDRSFSNTKLSSEKRDYLGNDFWKFVLH
jgi:hypothetical protein